MRESAAGDEERLRRLPDVGQVAEQRLDLTRRRRVEGRGTLQQRLARQMPPQPSSSPCACGGAARPAVHPGATWRNAACPWRRWRTTPRAVRRCRRAPPSRSWLTRQSCRASNAAWSMKSTMQVDVDMRARRNGLRERAGQLRDPDEGHRPADPHVVAVAVRLRPGRRSATAAAAAGPWRAPGRCRCPAAGRARRRRHRDEVHQRLAERHQATDVMRVDQPDADVHQQAGQHAERDQLDVRRRGRTRTAGSRRCAASPTAASARRPGCWPTTAR